MGVSKLAEQVFTRLEQPVFESLESLRRLGAHPFSLNHQQEGVLLHLADIHATGTRLLKSLPAGSTPEQVKALHTAGGRLSNALTDIKQARSIIDQAGGYRFGLHLNGDGSFSAAPKGTFPGIGRQHRQHRQLVMAGLAEPRSSHEAQLAAVEDFWKRWAASRVDFPQPPLNREANGQAIDRLQNAWAELAQVRSELIRAGV